MGYCSLESDAAAYARRGLELLFAVVTGFVTKTRWSRIGDQIR